MTDLQQKATDHIIKKKFSSGYENSRVAYDTLVQSYLNRLPKPIEVLFYQHLMTHCFNKDSDKKRYLNDLMQLEKMKRSGSEMDRVTKLINKFYADLNKKERISIQPTDEKIKNVTAQYNEAVKLLEEKIKKESVTKIQAIVRGGL